MHLVEGKIRLVGGAKDSEGRLEVNINGEWGTVCSKGWNSSDTVCQILGYTRAVKTTFGIQYDNLTNDLPIWFDEVQCSGNEQMITDCAHGPILNHLCSHSHDIGVECSSMF